VDRPNFEHTHPDTKHFAEQSKATTPINHGYGVVSKWNEE
jgi:hypothetical protein